MSVIKATSAQFIPYEACRSRQFVHDPNMWRLSQRANYGSRNEEGASNQKYYGEREQQTKKQFADSRFSISICWFFSGHGCKLYSRRVVPIFEPVWQRHKRSSWAIPPSEVDRERDKMGIQTVVDNSSPVCHARIMPPSPLLNNLLGLCPTQPRRVWHGHLARVRGPSTGETPVPPNR